MTSRHPRTPIPSDKDLRENPGIGQSPGIRSPEEVELLQGDNTVEGDIDNETNHAGGIDPRHRPRKNE